MSENAPEFPYEKIYEKEIEPYRTLDKDGELVLVNVKNPATHSSSHDAETTPAFFFNLGTILKDPDSCVESTSNHPKAEKARSQGKVMVFKKDNYLFSLQTPYQYEPNDTTTVIVLYPNDKSKVARTLTYFVKVNK